MEKVAGQSFWRRLTRSDLQTTSPIYMIISVYLGIILFVINVVAINLFSLSDIAAKWRDNCAEKISIEIPSGLASEEVVLKIKNTVLALDGDVSINVIGKEKMLATLKAYMSSRKNYDLPFPTVVEVQRFNSTDENIAALKTALVDISDAIKVHDHSKILNPAIKVSSFVESSYVAITILILLSLMLYVLIYCYQNILINKQNIYILTMLCADKRYIFRQLRIHLSLYFLISFGVSVVLSFCFGMYLFGNYSDIVPDIGLSIAEVMLCPIIVFAILLLVSKYATYFVIRNQSFDCF